MHLPKNHMKKQFLERKGLVHIVHAIIGMTYALSNNSTRYLFCSVKTDYSHNINEHNDCTLYLHSAEVTSNSMRYNRSWITRETIKMQKTVRKKSMKKKIQRNVSAINSHLWILSCSHWMFNVLWQPQQLAHTYKHTHCQNCISMHQ